MKSDTSAHITREQADEWATWFRAIADPTRILILHLLAAERRKLTTGEITAQIDVGQSTVSHHLARLADARFVHVERIGTASLWRINEACIEEFPTAAEIVMGRVPDDFARALESAQ